MTKARIWRSGSVDRGALEVEFPVDQIGQLMPPHLQSAWDRGVNAARQRLRPQANPFAPESQDEEFQTWEIARRETAAAEGKDRT